MALTKRTRDGMIHLTGELDYTSSAAAIEILANADVGSNQEFIVVSAHGLVKTAGAAGTFVTLEDSGGGDLAYLGTATADKQGTFTGNAVMGGSIVRGGGIASITGWTNAGNGIQALASATGPVVQVHIVGYLASAQT
jgi:hypothetical protein